MKLLLTAIGKRIQLIEHLNTQFYIIGVDSSASNPAKEFVEEFVSIPACTCRLRLCNRLDGNV